MAISIEKISEISAVSGNETPILEYLVPLIEKRCDSLEIDSIGNIIAFKKGIKSSKKVMLATHIDEVGFIVSDITEKGFIKFKAVGDIDPRSLVSKKVSIGNKGIKGIIGMKAIHLQKKEEREATVKIKELYIDIGEDTKKRAEKVVSLGDRITFLTEFKDLGDMVKGKALDRVGIIALYEAMKLEPHYDTYYVFSAQREVMASVMGRGMRVATHRIDPDFALIIDSVNTEDFMDAKLPSARLGEGAVIEYMDRTAMGNVAFTKAVEEMAIRNNIILQRKTTAYGTSVAGAVQTSATGSVTAVVSVPCRYSRTPVCLVNKNDIKAVCDTVCGFIKESEVIIDGATKTAD